MTNRPLVALSFAATLAFGAADASAHTWTSYFSMDYIDTSTLGIGEGYSISGPGDFEGALSNPKNCDSKAYAYLSTSEITSATERELMKKTILSAYLSGRRIRLLMSSSKCTGNSGTSGAPMYLAVAVEP